MIRVIAMMLLVVIGCTQQHSSPDHKRLDGKVYENGWVGSGGDNFKEQINAWFVKNTTQVNYCIKIDQQNFSAVATAGESIKKSIQFWKKEFAGWNKSIVNTPGFYQLATQEFVETSCDGQEDITFLFGSATLNQEQRQFLGDVKRHIGITVRTSYDRETLKGKGFIFVGSDLGQESFQNSAKIDPFWILPGKLDPVIIHELGHVFGLPHFSQGVMNEVFPEKLATNFGGLDVVNRIANGSYTVFNHPESDEATMLDEETIRWWGLPFTADEDPLTELNQWTLRVEKESDTDTQKSYKIFAHPKDSAESQLLGHVETAFSNDSFSFPADVRTSIVTVLHLPDEQKIFSREDRISIETVKRSFDKLPERWRKYLQKMIVGAKLPDIPFLYGPAFSQIGLAATLKLVTGEERPVYLQSNPDGIKVMSVSQGRLRLVFGSMSGANGF